MNSEIRGIVIDPGHGGSDPGATGNGIIEKDLNLEIAKEIEKQLKAAGVDATLIRTTDETISPTERVNRILNATEQITKGNFTVRIKPMHKKNKLMNLTK